ncbi:MAG TPA: bifunctional riboflavin kinase/FAD synthetase [Candidatus Binataceae bacterium]|nr:bifunctional riboflavin kinase/FAD synthetase [Candidatus Binataceae bacterium]
MKLIHDLDAMPPHPFPVVALGNFDGVHLGHQAILKTAIDRARSARGTSFALTFSPLPAKVLAPDRAPLMLLTAEDKFELMRRCGIDGVLVVNFTLELSRLSPREFVRDFLLGKIGARAIVVGHSVSFGHNRAGNAAALVELGREFGFEADIVGPIRVGEIEVSSTKVRELILGGDLKGAATLLGRYHFLTGTVVHGRERGREMGFPTANLASETECVPADGVYACRVILPTGAHPAICNIGIRPTFAESGRSIEAHIFDFDRDIYGQKIRLEMIERIRPEQKFTSAEELGRQIATDVRRAKEIVSAAAPPSIPGV